MTEVYHERLKSPIPKADLEQRTAKLQAAMKREGIDCIIAENVTQYLGGANRWLTDTTAENHYPQSSILPAQGEVGYIACSGPPLDLYPPSHLLRIGKPFAAAPYFSPFNFTNTWEGRFAVKWIQDTGAKKVGIAGMRMFYWNYYEYIHAVLPDVEIVDAMDMFDAIRAEKSPDEIEFARKAADVQDKTMGYLTAMALPGVREYEVRSKAMQTISNLGGEEMIVLIGSALRGETFRPLASFFQNRTLEKGDALYVRLCSAGPGGQFTTLGRVFSIADAPSSAMIADFEAAVAAEDKLAGLLQVGADPQVVLSDYNSYLAAQGFAPENGTFAYGQGYDHIERPSLQAGETMPLAGNMVMGVNISVCNATTSSFVADSYLLKPEGAVMLNKTPRAILRT